LGAGTMPVTAAGGLELAAGRGGGIRKLGAAGRKGAAGRAPPALNMALCNWLKVLRR
jgi:hypothetical protein